MVVLLRAIDMPRDMAASILMLMQRLRDGTHPQPPEALVTAMEAFDRMEIAGARSVLQLWRLVRQSGPAIAELAARARSGVRGVVKACVSTDLSRWTPSQ